jgi:hypothetical protein
MRMEGRHATVEALFFYPVKSCRGLALDRATVEPRGIRHDRRWMIVDAEGAFLTQRAEPGLARIAVAVAEDGLVLSAEGRGAVRVPFVTEAGGPRRRVQVWKDAVDAVDCGEDAAGWLGGVLGFRASLVFMPDDVVRPVKPGYARETDRVGFADGFPLLLASTASLDDLNARITARGAPPVPMDRFRPNVVVRGCAPWAEDDWKRVTVGDLPVRVVKPCDRCAITTTDQRTGERGVEPLRTLATFREREDKVYFAQNGVPDGAGSIAVGDRFTVVE